MSILAWLFPAMTVLIFVLMGFGSVWLVRRQIVRHEVGESAEFVEYKNERGRVYRFPDGKIIIF